ncbi:Zinc finger MYND domain-containing protein 11 [Halotydeus destructor]|nr:Zinc finger MYND domain-containing protein 11 [Halotydeus destructor]
MALSEEAAIESRTSDAESMEDSDGLADKLAEVVNDDDQEMEAANGSETEVDEDDDDDEGDEEEDDEENEENQSPKSAVEPVKIRRTSRVSRPNSLIFTQDTATLDSPPRKKRGRPPGSKNRAGTVTASPELSTVRNEPIRTSLRRPVRSTYANSVKKAVNQLTNQIKRRPGRPAKYSPSASPAASRATSNGVQKSPSKSLVQKVKSSSSPPTKMSPILTAILSGQPLARTKTGRPKGRPRKLPSLNEVILGRTKSPVNAKCGCDSKYGDMLANLEQILENRFMDQTKKLRRTIEERDNDNIRLQARIIALQKEVELLRKKMSSTEEGAQYQKDVEQLKVLHKMEIEEAKRKQWCCNCSNESIYFCCWNTSYCSLECQQHHWHAEHKKGCRRKENVR